MDWRRPAGAAVACAALTFAAWTGPAPGSASDAARGQGRLELPAAAEATVSRVQVRKKRDAGSPRVATMERFRFDYRPTVFFVIGRELDRRGNLWYRIRVPGRPNGQTGWVRSENLDLQRSVADERLVVDRSARTIELFLKGRRVLQERVAVGTADAPTPLGRFYLTAAFKPENDFLGVWAFETSAYAAISDWPRGGIVGLHGTSAPESIGHAASHGCIRVFNSTIRKLKRKVSPGTPLEIVR